MRNENSRNYLEVLGNRINQQLKQIECVPSVEIRTGNIGTRQDPTPIKLQAKKVHGEEEEEGEEGEEGGEGVGENST